ncbi:membrane progestin receptor delta isoform X2 [Pongo pygmaeus]|uniref:membrane progestin receptor delta isoform X2 n=1 Tax=Pongo pygmaeus TaxID=9600 RepID=UPI0023E1E138|nr:membrane progestin receptor delta isoform X1 [Pongo pygmaeus]XP_054407256.1 membrane progestin receptor delta isoform X2 [Pongo abelii]
MASEICSAFGDLGSSASLRQSCPQLLGEPGTGEHCSESPGGLYSTVATSWLGPVACSSQSAQGVWVVLEELAVCRRLSELPANGAGPPRAAPWRLDKAGIVPWLPFVSPFPAQAWPACLATLPPSAWLAAASDSARGALGLLTHQLRSTHQALGVLGRWHHVWLPPPHQLGFGLCPQLLPDDQRDGQHLDSLPAHLVLPVAAPGAGGRPRLPCGAVPLAAAGLPAARLPLPLRVVLRAHLQLHVAPRAPHLLLPGLRRAQPLQPGFLELESPGLSKVLRTGAFAYPFLFDNLPLFYRLGLCWSRGHSCGQEALSTSHGYHLFCALLTGFLFASHLPERLAPGRFDYIGHSHQLFHICAVLGTHFQLEAVLADMGSRRAWLATQEPALGLAGTVATLVLAVAGNLLIIAAFTATLLRAPSTCPLLQGGPLEGGTQAKQQ